MTLLGPLDDVVNAPWILAGVYGRHVAHNATIEKVWFFGVSEQCNRFRLRLVARYATVSAMGNKSPITKFRKAKDGMTLEDFGKLFKPAVDKSTVSRWERGHLPVSRILEIEKVTGINRRLLAPKMFKGLEVAE